MQTPTGSIESLFTRAKDYSNTTLELLKLKAIDKSTDVVSSLLSRLAILAIITLFILLISIGTALWIGELLGKTYYGFFITGGLYAVIAIVVHAFRDRWIKFPMNNAMIDQLLKQ